MSDEQRDTQYEADRYADGVAESALEKIFEESGRFSGFVGATNWEQDKDRSGCYFIEGYGPDNGDEPLLVHKETHEIFQADVWVSLHRTGDKWFAPDDESDEAVAQRDRKAKDAERRERQAARIKARVGESSAS